MTTKTEYKRKDAENIDPVYCRCGMKWGEHPSEWTVWGMKPNCVMCGNVIGVNKNKLFIPNQCQKRYIDKGNFCDKCNNQCGKASHRAGDSSEFKNMFKHKQK